MTIPEFPALLNVLEIGIAIHDEHGNPIFVNDAARPLLPAEHSEVDRTIRAALTQQNSGVVSVGDTVRICSMWTGSCVFTFLHRVGQVNLRLVACLFGLTLAEENVALRLASGKTARQIASDAGISLHTVHSHLKSMFAKTDTRSQNELIAILGGGLALIAIDEVRSLSPTIKGCTKENRHLPSRPRSNNHNRKES